MKYLIQCKRCGWNQLGASPPDRCPKCRSEKISASVATVLDPKNPSGKFYAMDIESLAFPTQPADLWNGFQEWVFEPDNKPFHFYNSPSSQPAVASNAHVSEIAEYNEMTLKSMEAAFNKAVADLQDNAFVGTGYMSDIVKKWTIPEPVKPAPDGIKFGGQRRLDIQRT